MSARDRYHDPVRNALVKDGWTITDDPLRIKVGKKDLYVDLGAERLIAATKLSRKIAVEVKSFIGPSEMTELEKAVGQYIIYRDILATTEPDREMFLAVPESKFIDLFEEPIGKILIDKENMHVLAFDPVAEEVRRWTH